MKPLHGNGMEATEPGKALLRVSDDSPQASIGTEEEVPAHGVPVGDPTLLPDWIPPVGELLGKRHHPAPAPDAQNSAIRSRSSLPVPLSANRPKASMTATSSK